jgi:alpha-amylase/alpha-mannosidase (GH57 family)
MNIKQLFQSLTPEEKKELYQCFSGNEYKAHRATIEEFINTIPNGRVKTSLQSYIDVYKRFYIDEIVEHRFLIIRNAGKKTWHDFQELLKDRI